MGLIQSLTLWLPFLSLGQAQCRHSPVDFLLANLSESIPSVEEWSFPFFFSVGIFFLDLNGLIRPVLVFPVDLRLPRSRNRFEFHKYSSHSLWTVSRLSSSDPSESAREGDLVSHRTSRAVVTSGSRLNSRPLRLSRWLINTCSRPIIDGSNQTHWATMIC